MCKSNPNRKGVYSMLKSIVCSTHQWSSLMGTTHIVERNFEHTITTSYSNWKWSQPTPCSVRFLILDLQRPSYCKVGSCSKMQKKKIWHTTTNIFLAEKRLVSTQYSIFDGLAGNRSLTYALQRTSLRSILGAPPIYNNGDFKMQVYDVP